MAEAVTKRPEIHGFAAIAEFKAIIGASVLKVMINTKKDEKTRFVASDTGAVFRCQQDIDTTKEMSFLIPLVGENQDGKDPFGPDYNNACLVNVNTEVLATL